MPAIAAIEKPPWEAGDVEDWVGAAVELDDALVDGAEGGLAVELGDWLLRHVASSEVLTIVISELPPVRPWASNIINTIDVP